MTFHSTRVTSQQISNKDQIGSDYMVYPNLSSCQPRARYYAQTLELEWIVRGLESGES